MRYQAFLVCLLVLCSLGLAFYIHHKRSEEIKLSKHASFENVKHRVTGDVLKEYMSHVVESSSLLDKTRKQIDDLKAAVAPAQAAADAKRLEVDNCEGDVKRVNDETAAIESEKTTSNTEFQKKKTGWQDQIVSLKKEMEAPSKVCTFINVNSTEAKKLCGIST